MKTIEVKLFQVNKNNEILSDGKFIFECTMHGDKIDAGALSKFVSRKTEKILAMYAEYKAKWGKMPWGYKSSLPLQIQVKINNKIEIGVAHADKVSFKGCRAFTSGKLRDFEQFADELNIVLTAIIDSKEKAESIDAPQQAVTA